MCNPMIALAAGDAALKGVGAVAGYLGQKQAYSDNYHAANFNYGQRMNALQTQGEQLSAQQSENSFDATIKRLQAAGRISASASDLGAGEGTTTAALHGAFGDIGRDQAIQDLNTQSQFNQLGTESMGASIARTSQINSVAKANPLSLVLGLGSAVVSGASTFAGLGGDLTGG